MTIRNLTVKQIAAVLNVPNTEAYGLLSVLVRIGAIKQVGSIKHDPNKRGRGEHLYQISVETPTAVALKLDTLLDAATESMSLSNEKPALVVEGPAPEIVVEVLATNDGQVVEIPGEESVRVELDAPALFETSEHTMPGLGPVL